MNQKKRIILITTIILIIAAFILFKIDSSPANMIYPTSTTTTSDAPSFTYNWSKDDYELGKEINEDFIGRIHSEADLFEKDLPFVQGEDNDKYVRTNWETMKWDESGTIFMDSSTSLIDNNITLYGHYVYPSIDPSGTKMFTPLHKLRDFNNYEEYKYIDLLLADEIRRYQIAAVYFCPLDYDAQYEGFVYTPDALQYYLPNFTVSYLEQYKKEITKCVNNIQNINDGLSGNGYDFNQTGVDIDSNDKLLTLQTCVYLRDDLRLIVVGKLIESIPLD